MTTADWVEVRRFVTADRWAFVALLVELCVWRGHA